MTTEPAPETTCEVCERTVTRRHPCRFERACSCWYGIPCDPPGASKRAMDARRPAVAVPTP